MPTKVEASARAMAVNGKTKTPITRPSRSVPPPEQCNLQPKEVGAGNAIASRELEKDEIEQPKPANISQEQWKRFQELRARREKESGKYAQRRKSAVRNHALNTVSREFSPMDRAVLEEEGVILPQHGRRRRRKLEPHVDGKRRKLEPSVDGKRVQDSVSQVTGEREEEWQGVRKYLDPNPHLKGVDKGRDAPKSGLEEEMDSAIERGEFVEAAAMSDRLMQRKFATQVASAFDCHEFVKRRKVEEERKRTKKPKLQWSFEHKQRWESKGNM